MGIEKPDTSRAARLVQARSEAGFRSSRAAAMQYGWKESTYRAHENGSRNYLKEEAEKYAQAFNVNIEWLWLGSGKKPSGMRAITHLPNVSSARQPVMPATKTLPVFGRAAGGPQGALLMTNQAVEEVLCPPHLDTVPDAYAVYVIGESMEPRYFPGEVVFVHPHRPLTRGCFVVVQVKASNGDILGFLKEFVAQTPTRVILRQLNPPEEMEFERSEVVSMHRIVFSGESR